MNPLPNGACAKFGYNFLWPVALEKEIFFNFVDIVLLFHYYLFKKDVVLLLEGRETLYPMCLVLLKFAQWL